MHQSMREEERRDRLYFRAFYPEKLGLMQDKIEAECDKLEYEGSVMFDEYPDKNSLLRVLKRITTGMEPMMEQAGLSTDIIEIMMLQEMLRRRIRWRRYKLQE